MKRLIRPLIFVVYLVVCVTSYVTNGRNSDASSNQMTPLQSSANEQVLLQKYTGVAKENANSSKGFGGQNRSKRHSINSKNNGRSRLKTRKNKLTRVKNRGQNPMTSDVTSRRVDTKHRRDDFRVYSSYGSEPEEFELTSQEVKTVFEEVPLIVDDMAHAAEQIKECYEEAVQENITDMLDVLKEANKNGEELQKVMEEVKHGLEEHVGSTLPTLPSTVDTTTSEQPDYYYQTADDNMSEHEEPQQVEVETVKPSNIWDEFWKDRWNKTLKHFK